MESFLASYRELIALDMRLASLNIDDEDSGSNAATSILLKTGWPGQALMLQQEKRSSTPKKSSGRP